MSRSIRYAAFSVAVLAGTTSALANPKAKNVILMISDGAGDTTWKAANQWQFGNNSTQQPWQSNPAYKSHWMSTFPGDTLPLPPGQTDVRLGFPAGTLPRRLPQLWNELPIPQNGSYDISAANDDTPETVRVWANANGSLLGDRGPRQALTPVASNPAAVRQLAGLLAAQGSVRPHFDQGFAAYDYLIWNSTTDSAAAGTALASGRKTYNSAINFIDNGTSLEAVPFITQQVKALGKKAGVVTTKPFTDATPAAFGTQDDFRDDEAAISDSMIRNGNLDVIITPGHPEFGGSSQTLSAANLAALRGGLDNWTFVDNNANLRAIGNGSQPAPERLFGMVPVGGSLNSRNTTGRRNAYDPRFYDPANPNGAVPFVNPDLDELSMAAINTLKQDPEGFFVMIEGASVDSAAHANNLPQLIEEQLQFNRAVDRVINWIETESSWDDTLLIVTTDHANGMFLGPDSRTVYFQDPVPGGAGELPQGIFWTTNHTNELVPLWSRGPGSELFSQLFDGVDPRRGQFVDNTDVYTVMSSVVPEPATMGLLAGAAVVALRRRK